MMIYSVLSIVENPVVQNLPYILLAIVGLALLIALIYGFSKGFRRVSWIGFTWAATAAAFFVFAKNPVIFNPVAGALGAFGTETASLLATIVLALAGVVLGLLLSTILKAIFKPKKAWAKRGDTFRNLYGIEYEGNETDYDDYPVTEKPVAVGYKKPTFFGRLLGAIFSLLNVATLLVAIVIGLLLIVDGSALKTMASALYQIKIGEIVLMDTARWVVADYGVDFLFLGIVLAFACKGKKEGFLKTLRMIVVKIFGILAAIVCAYLPFSPYADPESGIALLVLIVEKCTGFVAGFGLPEIVVGIAGKVLASIALILASVVITLLLKLVFALLISLVKKVKLLRKLDSALACVAYVIIGALVCALIWAVVYALAYVGWFDPNMLLSQNATVSRGLYSLMDTYFKPMLETVKGFLGM